MVILQLWPGRLHIGPTKIAGTAAREEVNQGRVELVGNFLVWQMTHPGIDDQFAVFEVAAELFGGMGVDGRIRAFPRPAGWESRQSAEG